MKKDQFQRILEEYSLQRIQQSFEDIHYEVQFEYFENQHSFDGAPLKVPLSSAYYTLIPSKIDKEDHQTSTYFEINHQNDVLKGKSSDQQQKIVSSREQKEQKEENSKSKASNNVKGDTQKPPKNHYDKNIFANICKTILKQMLSSTHQKQIRNYCLITGGEHRAFVDIFKKMDRQSIRMGTSELNHLLQSSRISLGFRKVFSYFFVRFLRDEYLQYVIHHGRMSDKLKYLRCASKMMYIPRLSQAEYRLLIVGDSAQNP